MNGDPLRISVLTYRGNPRSGGQGIYVRNLSHELRQLGHHVDVWSGQPYPELLPGAGLVKVPSLDLWNEDAFFRLPTLRELRDPINVSEWADTMTGGFAEPRTFTQRVARSFRSLPPEQRYDVVHDNQSLGWGLIELQERVPVVGTIHHPVTVDRRLALKAAPTWRKWYGLQRWYTFLRMQLRVARQLDRVLTVSDSSAGDLVTEYGLRPDRVQNVGNGINVDLFRPMPSVQRNEDHLITTLSADSPLKGFSYLLDAFVALREERPALKLTVIGGRLGKRETAAKIDRLNLNGSLNLTGKVEPEDIVKAYAESTVAIVPSLYEGFGFPAGEAMACEVPVVSTTAGALPEVVGREGDTGVLVQPGCAVSLARAIRELLDAPERRREVGVAGRKRVQSLFTWRRAAERTVEVYRELIETRSGARC